MEREIIYTHPKSILNPGNGYLSGYSHSLNPYAGCAYGCSYCYVRQMPVALFRSREWGTWIDVKQEAATLLRKQWKRAKAKGPLTIFMSSSTDPYQPVEHRERVTRSLLEVMADDPPDFLFVQTRSPLVCRDIDLFLRLEGRVRVSMTVETDRDDMRRHFTPGAPPIPARLQALKTLAEAGVPTQATIAPLLPCSERFAAELSHIVDRICLDDYYMGDGSGGRRTIKTGVRELYEQIGMPEWFAPGAYRMVYEQLLTVFHESQVRMSQDGFAP